MASYDDTATVSGSVVGFSNGADSVPLKNWLVTLPASLDGYSEVNGTQSGKNISSVSEYPSNPYIFWGTNFTDMVNFLNTLKKGTYTISFDFEVETLPDSGDIQYGLPYIRALVGGSYVSLTSYSISAASSVSVGDIFRVSASFTLTDERVGNVANCYIYCDRKDTHSGTGRGSYNLINVQIEVGSTATAYEAYAAPTQYTASLGRTIYGGTADIVTGEGEDGYTKPVITSNMVTSAALESQNRIWRVQLNTAVYDGSFTYQIGVCNNLTFVDSYTNVANTDMSIAFNINTGKQILLHNSNLTTVDEVKAFIDTLDMIYPLATPTDFTFNPVTIETSKGSNTFWSEQGNNELTYYKDGYGFTSVTIHKETPDGEPVEETRKLHRIIYEGQVDVISGTGLIYRGESGTQYDPPEQISFTPIEVSTDEGENTLYADQGNSAITYRKAVD